MNNFFSKLKSKSILFGAGVSVAAGVCLWIFSIVYQHNLERQARFNMDVLERYIYAHWIIEGKTVEGLSQLPDFHVISTYDSLQLRGRDIRGGIFKGYAYDMTFQAGGNYAVSASPVGFLAPSKEFGFTNVSGLRYNTHRVDTAADGLKEIERWWPLPRIERVRSKKQPEYIEN